MAIPLLGLLAGAGLLGAQSHFANTAGSNSPILNRLLNIRQPQPGIANLGRVDLMSETAPQQLQALAAQNEANPAQQQYLFDRALRLRDSELALQERMANAAQTAAVSAEQERYDRRQELLAREDQFRKDYVRQFGALAEAQANFKALENVLVSGSSTDAVGATFGVMKVFDPTSTVRTEEGRQVVTAQGPAASLANELNRLLAKGWNENTRREWYDTVARYYKPRAESGYRALEDWRNRAQEQGFADSATRGAGLDVDRLRATAQGTRASPFAPVTPPAPRQINSEGQRIVTGPQGQQLILEEDTGGGLPPRARRRGR